MSDIDFSKNKYWKDIKNLSKDEYRLCKWKLKMRGMRHVDSMCPITIEYFKENSLLFKLPCRVCGSIVLFRDLVDGLCPRCSRTDLEDMPRRVCTRCGVEAHSVEDLDNFTKNIKSEYKRANLCKSCTNKLASIRWMRGREQRLQKGLKGEEVWDRKKFLADRYLRLIKVWGYV